MTTRNSRTCAVVGTLAAQAILGCLSAASHAQVLYVDAAASGANNGTSWADACRYLQDALASASASGGTTTEIRVAKGTYKPDQGAGKTAGDRTATFLLLNGVSLKGGYAGVGSPDPDVRDIAVNETILSGDLLGNDGPAFANNTENSQHVVTGLGTNNTAVLDGFTITSGNATGSNPANGAGLYNGWQFDQGAPTVTNCLFRDNSASYGGAIMTSGGPAVIADCVFVHNRTAGGSSSHPSGGAIAVMFGSPSITRCTFTSNSAIDRGGALYVSTPAATIGHCTFLGNSAGQGGAVHFYGVGGTLTNCLLVGNTAANGGALATSAYPNPINLKLVNCTVAHNSAADQGGGVYLWTTVASISNCILWGNTAATTDDASSQVFLAYQSSVTINYSSLQGYTSSLGGVGNTASDPLLIDPDGPDSVLGTFDDNLRVRPGSPCLDAGDNGAISPGLATDLAGNPRVADDPLVSDTGNGTPPIVDLGAYEGAGACFTVIGDLVTVPEGGTATFTVALAQDPGGTLQVGVSSHSGDPDISVRHGAMLTFDSSNFDVPQTVTLAAAEDIDFINGTTTIRVGATGVAAQDLTAIEADNDSVPPVLYVNAAATGAGTGASWPDAMTRLQDALAVAAGRPGIDEIWVATGTYKPAGPGGDRTATFQLTSGVGVYGGFAGAETDLSERNPATNLTVLSGDLNGDDGASFANNGENSFHVVTGTGTDATAILDGFTIRGGNADGLSAEPENGGGMYNHAGSPTVVNCVFTGNFAELYGGGAYNAHGTPTFTNCAFTGNRAYQGSDPGGGTNGSNGYGGAVGNKYGGSPVLADCTFDNNLAGMYGGAMASVIDSHPTLTRCTFTGNNAESGQAVWNSGATSTFTDCTFQDNGAGSYGETYAGAVSASGSLTLRNCLFARNRCSRDGGAISAGGELILSGCTFIDNVAGGTAGSGGAISTSSCRIVAADCVFLRNKVAAGSPKRGGAVYMWKGTGYFANCVFRSNNGTDGGAMCTSADSTTLVNCVFTGNSAQNGGALLGGVCTVVNCSFAGNTSTTAGGAGIVAIGTFANCLLWGNRNNAGYTEQAQIRFNGTPANVNYCCIQGLTGTLGGVGNTGADPRLVDADGLDDLFGTDDDNLRLMATSPCIDASDNASVPVDTADLDHDGDVTEPVPLDLDRLARFVDDPTMPDLGQGTPPIVDMGAYEGPHQGLLFAPLTLNVPEGSTASIDVRLAVPTQDTVVMSAVMLSGDPDITVRSGATLTFNPSNWDQPQAVVFGAAEDRDLDNNTATLLLRSEALASLQATITEIDNDKPTVLFVNAAAPPGGDGFAWATAYNDLQSALDIAAGSGGMVKEIWLARGTYRPTKLTSPTDPRTATFTLFKSVALYGGFAGTEAHRGERDSNPATNGTVLSGDLNGDDGPNFANNGENAYHVLVATNTDNTTLLEGLSIRGGNAGSGSSPNNYGGGIYNNKGSPLISNCLFTANKAASGGGMYNEGGAARLANCTFTGNSASGGAGVYNSTAATTSLSDCTFDGNTATSGGGGVRNSSTNSVSLTGCTFTRQTASAGGGVYDDSSGTTVTNCTFSNNTTTSYGGGLYASSSKIITVTGCTFTGNIAQGAGGATGNGTFTDCTFTGNQSTREGGGLYGGGNLIRCRFESNTASTYGGGLCNFGGTTNVTGCTFIGNSTPNSYGGGISHQSGILNLTNCVLIANSAKGTGGGLSSSTGGLTLTNCTFALNTSLSNGGGLSAVMSYSRTVRNCIFWANSDSTGSGESAQIYRSSGPILNMLYNCVQDWSGTLGGTGNIGSDPLFVNAAGNDVHLTHLSPCIDAGDPASVFSQEPEPDGGRINMGAYGNTPEAETRGWLYIDAYGQMNRVRVGRTVFDYQLNVTMRNAAATDANAVTAQLLAVPMNVQMIEGVVDLGKVPAGASVVSQDTFTIRVDRSLWVSPLPISWTVAYDGGTTMFTALLDPAPGGSADFNGDGAVNAVDLDIFEACETGPAISYRADALPDGCVLTADPNGVIAADFDADGDVDQADFGVFQPFLGTGEASGL